MGRLVAWSGALLVVIWIGAIVAIAAGWPAQFGGGGDAGDVAGEALTRGTALSPPLGPVVVLADAPVLAVRRGAVGNTETCS